MNLDNKKIELYNCVYILVAVDQRTTVFPSNDQMHQQQANGNVNMAHIYVYISTFYFVRSFFFSLSVFKIKYAAIFNIDVVEFKQ